MENAAEQILTSTSNGQRTFKLAYKGHLVFHTLHLRWSITVAEFVLILPHVLLLRDINHDWYFDVLDPPAGSNKSNFYQSCTSSTDVLSAGIHPLLAIWVLHVRSACTIRILVDRIFKGRHERCHCFASLSQSTSCFLPSQTSVQKCYFDLGNDFTCTLNISVSIIRFTSTAEGRFDLYFMLMIWRVWYPWNV